MSVGDAHQSLIMSISPSHAPEIPLPQQFWNEVSQDDRTEFLRLHSSFHHGQKISSKDRRIVTFGKELTVVLQYLERSQDNMEARCVLAGLCFVGPYVCVNTRQLKSFLGRCKSSINGSFQQLGYVALRTKSKARNCVTTALPSLASNQNILRQWTVRYVSDETRFCFISSFSHVQMPLIEEDDLFEEKKTTKLFQPQTAFPYRPVNVLKPLQTKHIGFDLPSIEDFDPDEAPMVDASFQQSFSMDCMHGINEWDAEPEITMFDSMTRSTSVSIHSEFGDTLDNFF